MIELFFLAGRAPIWLGIILIIVTGGIVLLGGGRKR